ncbi:MAG: hypothetical protein APR62_00655 [Smithella sp. SDB]|nr:MAG: hypothetical protein APR62_00655 [Smithella sp. SDB]
MENTTLENSIREESARAIAAIKEKEALEIMHMDEIYSSETDNFRKQTESETEMRIRQELLKIKNKTILERRKIKLRSIEKFINRIVDEAVKEIRSKPHYKQFLIESICNFVKEVQNDVEIRLSAEDLFLEKDILAAIAAEDGNHKVVITADVNIKWGGCLILDKERGLIFNNTLERIYFRKSLLIRQRVTNILMKNSQDV